MRTWQVERRRRTRHLIELGGLVVKAGIVDLTGDDRAMIYGALLWMAEMRWSPFAGHFGGFAKLGSGVCHAALLMPSQAMWTSSGVLPPRAEWGLVRL
ncbi:conjugal transfer protein TraD [Ancylobacter sp. IITR112]|uniref:conjugal transfer protein TraD n=1 Tax=Ancylobacter sp. IITR112 TaxID=3138073 RepID=UPI00352A0ECC